MPRLFFTPGQVIKENKSWFLMAAAIFLGCSIIFYIAPAFSAPAAEEAMDSQLEQLEGLFSLIMETTPLVGISLIFMNNFLSMAQMLLLGFIAGVSPLVTLGINGALVGALLSFSAQEGVPVLQVIVLGLLPHGIFELFAFFLCAGIGLKFGYHCIASPLPGKTRGQSFRYIWKEAISILPLVVVLLLAAAVIEVLITPQLMGLIL